MFSRVNVEKVVRPPQNPTAKKRCCATGTVDFDAMNPIKKPSSVQPITLANKVANGICEFIGLRAIPIMYRSKLPKPPPTKTNKRDVIFIKQYF